jgi:hypothetical protein
MRHRKSSILLAFAVIGAAVLSLASPGLRGATVEMPVSEVRPGMVGTGHTVFDGTHVEEFKAHILGVLENVIGTQRNLILARLEGGPLANTGVIAGMSGSPGVHRQPARRRRVVCAGQLFEGTDRRHYADRRDDGRDHAECAAATGSRVHLEYPLTRENLQAAFRKALNWNRPFADRPGDAQFSGVTAVANVGGAQLGTLLRPIATPLVMAGFEPEIADMLGSAFREQGFIPMGGNAAGFHRGEKPFEGPLKPGDGVGVMLVSGDLTLGATGTVTHIDGDRVYAFGHPMYNLGPTEFPMTRAYTYVVLPSLFSSMKLSSTGEIIGTVLQDRATAIAGKLGPGPRMMPVTVALESNRRPTRTFKFGVVNDPLFGPLMTYATIVNTLTSYERQFESMTLSVRGTAKVRKHDAIGFNNLFSGEQAATAAAAYVVRPDYLPPRERLRKDRHRRR